MQQQYGKVEGIHTKLILKYVLERDEEKRKRVKRNDPGSEPQKFGVILVEITYVYMIRENEHKTRRSVFVLLAQVFKRPRAVPLLLLALPANGSPLTTARITTNYIVEITIQLLDGIHTRK